ncbi:MAG: metallophosphoesterase [Bacteroidetes bacterium]|nr:metallophosphoesterase [Bacteroidota bacterium]
MKTSSLAVVVILACAFCSFKQPGSEIPVNPATDPFSNGGSERNMIVVISDLHLGANLAYAEINRNCSILVKLLQQVSAARNVKELVIAGDLLDEWFVPATINTYDGKDQHDFVQRIAATNQDVFDAFNRIIREGKIAVTYVPGNHDLSITAENVAGILPGINQARDNMQGLGTYSPAGNPRIAIEHGHRYNFFCAPDPISNQDIAPGTIMPPGYFFTRIAALHVMQHNPAPGEAVAVVTPNPAGGVSQNMLYAYWSLWKWAIKLMSIENKLDEKIIVTNVGGFTGACAVNDLLPFQLTTGGDLDVKLYKGIQDTWDQRQTINKVAVKIPVMSAIVNAASDTAIDNQAKVQYFMNPNSNTRIVVFGHTHVAKMTSSANCKGQKSIYVNSGTWIDNNNSSPGISCTFVVITPPKTGTHAETRVKLYNFNNSVMTEMAQDSLRY